jgi:DNA-binding MarR family transcriptional regulator
MSLQQPLDLSHLDTVAADEIAPLVERAAAEADADNLARLTDLLLDRALRLLREGSRQEILDEALAVSGGVSGETGRMLRERNPETFGAWAALDDLLAEAARRSDRAAVPSLLRSTEGHGLKVLELLAEKGQAVPRAEIRERLNLAEAHLSHLLRDLEEADLIVRYRVKGKREVLVELGRVGKEEVERAVLPAWLERLASALTEIAAGSLVDFKALAGELRRAGAPSELAAVKLAEALSCLPHGRDRRSDDQARQFVLLTEESEGPDYHSKKIAGPRADRPPKELFGFVEERPFKTA